MSVSFLRAGRCRGVLGNRTPPPPHLKIGTRVFYDLADLDRWLEERKVQPGAAKTAPRKGTWPPTRYKGRYQDSDA